MQRLIAAAALALAASLQLTPASAAPQPSIELAQLTTGPHYDRNAVTLDDGNTTWMFFARSQLACNRMTGCNNDDTAYDLYAQTSSNKGKSWSAPFRLAANPGPSSFYGRTISAVRTSDGTVHVLWASGGSGGPLYHFTKPHSSAAFSLADTLTSAHYYFNAWAVASGKKLFLYSEAADNTGIYVQTLTGSGFSTPIPVFQGSIPKVIVDKHNVFRMTMVDGANWPYVSVLTSSSSDGVAWSTPQAVVVGDGTVTNWDPSLLQASNGDFYLTWAPDQGDGRQRIEARASEDFVHWSASVPVTLGTDGTTAYWDYWPIATGNGNNITLMYTSEAAGAGTAVGIGHIWAISAK